MGRILAALLISASLLIAPTAAAQDPHSNGQSGALEPGPPGLLVIVDEEGRHLPCCEGVDPDLQTAITIVNTETHNPDGTGSDHRRLVTFHHLTDRSRTSTVAIPREADDHIAPRMHVAPGGRQVVFHLPPDPDYGPATEQLLVVDADTGGFRQLPTEPAMCTAGVHHLEVSDHALSDTGLLAVHALCHDEVARFAPVLMLIDVGTAAIVGEWEDPSSGGGYTLTRDGSHLIVSRWMLEIDDNTLRQWTDAHPREIVASADGRQLAYTLSGGSRADGIEHHDLATGVTTSLVSPEDTVGRLTVTDIADDGHTVLFHEDLPDAASQAYLVGPDRPRTLVSSDATGAAAAASVDGHPLACDRRCGRVLFTTRTGAFEDPHHEAHPFTAAWVRVVGDGVTSTGAPRAGLSDTLHLSPATTRAGVTQLSLAIAAESNWAAGDVVLLARNDGFADSLAAGALQHLGPLLLTDPDGGLPTGLRAALDDRRPSEVLILGGTSAVPSAVEAELDALVIPWTRLAGASRLDTAAQVAAESLSRQPAGTVLLARAFGTTEDSQAYADALAGGALAADRAWPILLTPTDQLAGQVTDVLDAHPGIGEVVILGGEAAVSSAVAQSLLERGLQVRRLAGPDRAATAVAIAAERGATGVEVSGGTVLVESGGTFGWAGGMLLARRSAATDHPIVLGQDDGLPAQTRTFLDGGVASVGEEVVITCVVADVTCEEGRRTLGLPPPVEVTLDPAPDSVVLPGARISVALDPMPAEARVSVGGSCVSATEQPLPLSEGGVLVRDDAPDQCRLYVLIRHAVGTVQNAIAEYRTSSAQVVGGFACDGLARAEMSGDGRWIVYPAGPRCPHHDGGDTVQIAFVEIATGEAVTVPTGHIDGYTTDVQVSSDGAYAVMDTAPGLLAVERDTGEVWDVAEPVAGLLGSSELPNVSTAGSEQSLFDGHMLAVAASGPEVDLTDPFVVDLRTRTATAPFDGYQDCGDSRCWWPGPTVNEAGTHFASSVGLLDTRTMTMHRFPDSRAGLLLSDDGDTMVFQQLDETAGYRGAWVLDVPTGEVRQVSAEARATSLSGDGRWLALEEDNQGTPPVVIDLLTDRRVPMPEVEESADREILLSDDGSVVAIRDPGGIRLVDGLPDRVGR